MAVTTVTGPGMARALAERLNDPSRDRVVVVVTTPAHTASPFIDVERIADEVGDVADVVLLTTGAPSWEFSAGMAAGTQVYGGAGRVYPLGLDWVTRLSESPLRFAYSPADGPSATTRLIGDALAAVGSDGFKPAAPIARATEVVATVAGAPTPSQLIVTLPTGGYATVRTARLFPDVTADHLLSKGMQVTGMLDPATKVLDLSGYVPDPGSRLAELVDGDVVPVQVATVRPDSVDVVIVPGSVMTLHREAVTDADVDDLRDLLTDGEITLARIERQLDGPLTVSLDEVDASDIWRPALAVWPGGPPWLPWPPSPQAPPEDAAALAPRPAEAPLDVDAPVISDRTPGPVTERVPDVATPRPSPILLDRSRGTAPGQPMPAPPPVAERGSGAAVRDLGLSLATAKAQLVAAREEAAAARAALRPLEAEVSRLEAEAVALRRTLDRRERELADLKTRHRSALKQRPPAPPDGPSFTDPEEQFRWEVTSAWARRIPAAEKAAAPLAPYTLGPSFLMSLDTVEGISRAKVVDVVVEVLCGKAETNPGRELHALRTATGGGSDAVRRDDATCWRVSLQTNSASARRLHFWRSSHGIELSRVVLHDDFDP